MQSVGTLVKNLPLSQTKFVLLMVSILGLRGKAAQPLSYKTLICITGQNTQHGKYLMRNRSFFIYLCLKLL